jgi:5-methylcytosine-specific restriction endonuclease McrA
MSPSGEGTGLSIREGEFDSRHGRQVSVANSSGRSAARSAQNAAGSNPAGLINQEEVTMFAANPALVLNADFQPLSYFPLSLFNWEDAVKAVIRGSHVVVAEYDQDVRSPSTTMRLPSIVALRDYVRPPARVAFTRFNVFLRDRFRCQYCGEQHLRGELTFDHVVPRADGGQTCWTNIVAACSPCNTRKARLHLRPLRRPFEPTQHDLIVAQKLFPPNFLHETWRDYLYWDVELEH